MTDKELIEYLNYHFTHLDGVLYYKNHFFHNWNGKVAGSKKETNRYRLNVNGKYYFRSRLIFLLHNGYMPAIVDHKDFNTLNDKPNNLRAATVTQSNRYKRAEKNCSSKYKGVSYRQDRNRAPKYIAHIMVNKVSINLGQYKTELEAVKAYNQAAIKYHGEFAFINPIEP